MKLENYETRMVHDGKRNNREVKIICEYCEQPTWVKWQRVREGRGRYCSRQCYIDAGSPNNPNAKINIVGKKNAGKSFDKSANRYMAYWIDEETGKSTTTTYARWYWEVNRGEIPEGYRASFKDGNTLNIDPENITLLSPEEFGDAASKRLMGHVLSEETKQKISNAHSGKELSTEHKMNISNSLRVRWDSGEFDSIHKGKNSALWKGGVDKQYPPEFNNDLREFIRGRDNHKCKICGGCNVKYERALHVHHMDGNKKNSNQENLISLCNVCHGHVHGKHNVNDPVILAFRSMLTNL